MIKIAFPTNDGKTIFPHFGRAQYFQIVTLRENETPNFEMWVNNEQCKHDDHDDHDQHHHKSFDALKDCQIVMAGGMGQNAYDKLVQLGIKVLLPTEKDINAALAAYQAGTLISNTKSIHPHHHH